MSEGFLTLENLLLFVLSNEWFNYQKQKNRVTWSTKFGKLNQLSLALTTFYRLVADLLFKKTFYRIDQHVQFPSTLILQFHLKMMPRRQ